MFFAEDEGAHHFAEHADVVLGLGRVDAFCETERGEIAAQGGERRFAGISDRIGARIQGDRRLAGANEDCIVFFL